MSKIVDYYLTPQSPWAYLGGKRFAEIVKKHGATVAVKPIDLGKAFSVSGGLPLAKRPPQRQAYRLLELARWKKKLGVPLVTACHVLRVAVLTLGAPAAFALFCRVDRGVLDPR